MADDEHEQQQPAPPPSRGISAKLVIAAIVGIVLLVFALLNTDDVKVDFIIDTYKAPLIVVILVAAVLGAIIVALVRFARLASYGVVLGAVGGALGMSAGATAMSSDKTTNGNLATSFSGIEPSPVE